VNGVPSRTDYLSADSRLVLHDVVAVERCGCARMPARATIKCPLCAGSLPRREAGLSRRFLAGEPSAGGPEEFAPNRLRTLVVVAATRLHLAVRATRYSLYNQLKSL
jgi:hypothetical protein